MNRTAGEAGEDRTMYVTTIKTGVVKYMGRNYWVCNSCVNREPLLYIIPKNDEPPMSEAEKSARLAAIKSRGWAIWWQSHCVVSTGAETIEWRRRYRDDPIPTTAEIESRLSGEPDTDAPFGCRNEPVFGVGGEWVPESSCVWITRRGGRAVWVD